jgi:hypothetical protein
MSLATYQNSAVAQADSILENYNRRLSNEPATSQATQEQIDPRRSYQQSLFQHTNTQYLKAKQRLVKQSMRRSRNQVHPQEKENIPDVDGIDIGSISLTPETSNSSQDSRNTL